MPRCRPKRRLTVSAAKLPKLSDVATTLSVDIETLDLATHECKDIRTRLRESERIPPEEIEEVRHSLSAIKLIIFSAEVQRILYRFLLERIS